jgi:hypothetical protein
MVQLFGFLVCQVREPFSPSGVYGIFDDFFWSGTSANLLLNFHANRFEIQAHPLKNAHRDSLTELDQSEENMFGSNVVVIKTVSLLTGQCQDLLGARCEIAHIVDYLGEN